MKKSVLILASVFLGGFFVSCSKGGTPNPTVDLITRAEWKISKYEERVNSGPYVDQYPSWPACTQDDRYDFKSDFTYDYNEGPTKCSSTDPQIIYTGIWELSPDGTKITLNGKQSTIDQLNDNTLIISGSSYTNPDTNYYKTTFTR